MSRRPQADRPPDPPAQRTRLTAAAQIAAALAPWAALCLAMAAALVSLTAWGLVSGWVLRLFAHHTFLFFGVGWGWFIAAVLVWCVPREELAPRWQALTAPEAFAERCRQIRWRQVMEGSYHHHDALLAKYALTRYAATVDREPGGVVAVRLISHTPQSDVRAVLSCVQERTFTGAQTAEAAAALASLQTEARDREQQSLTDAQAAEAARNAADADAAQHAREQARRHALAEELAADAQARAQRDEQHARTVADIEADGLASALHARK